jgi:hypothetical protein
MPFNFFTIKQTPNRYFQATTAYYPEAVPLMGSGTVDVYGGMRWKNTGSLEEVPQISLQEYKLNTGARTSNLMQIWGEMVQNLGQKDNSSVGKALSNIGSTAVEGIARSVYGDPYQGLYKGEPTGFYYNLPYIRPGSIRGDGMKNTWSEDQTIFDMLGKAFPTISSLGNNIGTAFASLKDEGWGAEIIKKYTGSTARSVTITFPLYNTYSVKEANDNFSFISLFAFQNLKTRTSYMTFLPPKVYTVDTLDEGGVYMPIAVVTDFKVEGMGTLRRMNDFGTADAGPYASSYRLVPEAYKISITLTELIPETTNIMQGVLGQSKVQVINNSLGGSSINGGSSGGGLFDFQGSGAGTTGSPGGDVYSLQTMSGNDNQLSEADSSGVDHSAALAALTTPEALSSTGLDTQSLKEYIQSQRAEETLTDINVLTSQARDAIDEANLVAYQDDLAVSKAQLSSTTSQNGPTELQSYLMDVGMLDRPSAEKVLMPAGMNEGINEETSTPSMNLKDSGYVPGMGMERELPANNVDISPSVTAVDQTNLEMGINYLKVQQILALQESQQTGNYESYASVSKALDSLLETSQTLKNSEPGVPPIQPTISNNQNLVQETTNDRLKAQQKYIQNSFAEVAASPEEARAISQEPLSNFTPYADFNLPGEKNIKVTSTTSAQNKTDVGPEFFAQAAGNTRVETFITPSTKSTVTTTVSIDPLAAARFAADDAAI